MTDREKVIEGLECHLARMTDGMINGALHSCLNCPFKAEMNCSIQLIANALELLKEPDAVIDTANAYENGEYDVLDLLSGAWHGKQYYFRERNGMIYSRDTCQYMTLDEAITEFMNRLGDDGSI